MEECPPGASPGISHTGLDPRQFTASAEGLLLRCIPARLRWQVFHSHRADAGPLNEGSEGVMSPEGSRSLETRQGSPSTRKEFRRALIDDVLPPTGSSSAGFILRP